MSVTIPTFNGVSLPDPPDEDEEPPEDSSSPPQATRPIGSSRATMSVTRPRIRVRIMARTLPGDAARKGAFQPFLGERCRNRRVRDGLEFRLREVEPIACDGVLAPDRGAPVRRVVGPERHAHAGVVQAAQRMVLVVREDA